MLGKLALSIAKSLSTDTLRSLVDLVFVRTRRGLANACADPRAAQAKRLRTILTASASTEFGRAHDFASLAAIEDDAKLFDAYRAKVKLRTWDDVEPLVARMLKGEHNVIVSEEPYFFATTSGTTGRRKLIPVTSQFVDECRVGNKVMFRSTLLAMPALLQGKRLNMRSPKVEKLDDKHVAGSITVALGGGFEDEENALDAVPVEVFFVDDFATRYFLALRFALQEPVRMVSSVNPSTLLLFARTLADRATDLAHALEHGTLGVSEAQLARLDPQKRATLERKARIDVEAAARVTKSASENAGRARMRDVLPGLVGLACWKGGSAPWYLDRLKESYGDAPVLDYGYCASEGIFGAPLSTEGAASVLMPHGHVIELAPFDAMDDVRAGKTSTVLLHEAEVGRRYFVIVTTGAGLYRYEMNDVVEVTGKHGNAPLVVFLHKGGAMSSLTGEKISEAHVVNAMARVSRTVDVAVKGFVVAPCLPESTNDAPRYVIALDVDDVHDLAAIAAKFDEALRAENEEYDAKRKSLRLDAAIAVALPKDAIVRHRRRRVDEGAPDAHVKIPHVSADGSLLVDLGVDDTAPTIAARLPIRASTRVTAATSASTVSAPA